ncbi:glycosyltransferase family 2 protein [Chitinophaga sp. 30R24]|uniref:glycosyltransferase family 2 protein n=1 Tax=Chitinophaga sp. 30R24 TaxID=3248838 RepID=UPI003B8F6D68
MMILRPTITIITVVFNGVNTIEETIKSVLSQTYQSIQYIVLDGGSTDGTVEILKQYNSCISFWKSEPDKGIYDAMNKAVSFAAGDYIYFLGSDDVLASQHSIEKMVAHFKDDRHIYYGNVYFKHRNVLYDGKFDNHKFCLRNISHQAIFYPIEVFKQFKFDLKYKYLADYVMNLQLKALKYNFTYIDHCVCIYNDEGQSGVNQDLVFLEDRMRLLRQAFPWYIAQYARVRTKLKKLLFE